MNARQRAQRRKKFEPKVAQLKEIVAQINFLSSQCCDRREAESEKAYWRQAFTALDGGGRFSLADEYLDLATARLASVKYRFENPNILSESATMTGRMVGKSAALQNFKSLQLQPFQEKLMKELMKHFLRRSGDVQIIDDRMDALQYTLTSGYGVKPIMPQDIVKVNVT